MPFQDLYIRNWELGSVLRQDTADIQQDEPWVDVASGVMIIGTGGGQYFTVGTVSVGSSGPPADPAKQPIWLDTSTSPPVLKVWDGAQWVSASHDAAIATLADVEDAPSTVAGADQGAVLVRDTSVAEGQPGAWKAVEVLDAGEF